MTRPGFVVLALAVGFVTAASAQTLTAEQRTACKADFEKFCQGTTPGGWSHRRLPEQTACPDQRRLPQGRRRPEEIGRSKRTPPSRAAAASDVPPL